MLFGIVYFYRCYAYIYVVNGLCKVFVITLLVWFQGTCAKAQSAAIFTEGFDSGTSGWTATGSFAPTHSPSGGNPGGALSGFFPGAPTAPNDDSFVAGPSASGGAFTGNLGQYDNPVIAFDFSYTSNNTSYLQIILESDQEFLVFDLSVEEPGAGIWQTYEIPLSFDPSIHDGEATYHRVMSNVTAMIIYTSPKSTGSFLLDNVSLAGSFITITEPSGEVVETTNATIQLAGSAFPATGISRIEVHNFRDVGSYAVTGITNWVIDSLPVFAGENFIEVMAIDAENNVLAKDHIIVNYSGDDQYEDLLRSGAVIQHIEFPDDLQPGDDVIVRWQVLSYVPVTSRLDAGVPEGWLFYRNGQLAGVSNSTWNLDGRQAMIYAFECNWPVPEKSGDFFAWFNIAQMDGYQFMIPVIPEGVDARPASGRPKLIQRTILPGGNGDNPASDQSIFNAGRVFETTEQSLLRSSTTITSVTLPDNLKTGEIVSAYWTLQSYQPVDAELLVVNVASTQVWLEAEGASAGTPEQTTYSLIDRSSGTRHYASLYRFTADFTVPNQPGEQQVYFRARPTSDTNAPWMASTVNAGVDSRNFNTNGMFGRFIERTIQP